MCSWYKFLKNVVSSFKDEGYVLNQIAGMNLIEIANKLDMSYDYYSKHHMHAVEKKLFSRVNKDKNLIKKFNRKNWRRQLIRKYSHIPFIN